MSSQRIVVVSACSKRKLRGRLRARDRYDGRAHRRVRGAIDRWRAATPNLDIRWFIASAGLGLVSEFREIPEYDASFVGCSDRESIRRGGELGMPAALAKATCGVDLSLIVLPRPYVLAIGPLPGGPTPVRFVAPSLVAREAAHVSGHVIASGVADAKRLGVPARDVAAVRFEHFVTAAIQHGIEDLEALVRRVDAR